jgi:hypothetical protein
MILIKSLIVLLLIIMGYYLYNNVSLSKFFDGREGFGGDTRVPVAGEEQGPAGEEQEEPAQEEPAVETKYSAPSPAKTQQQMNDDSVMLGDLQDKMTELLKLKDQAAEINSSLKK